MQSSVEYLGHRIDAEGLHTTAEKLKAIVEAPKPTNVQELCSFLGLLNYYGKFIQNLSTILHPLNSLLQQDRQWEWNADCKQAFKEAKDSLTSSKVLVHYDPSLPLRLAADASAYWLGAVISHTMPDGTERPIAYASRSLSASERNYAQLEKEALALIFGIKKFHQYLFGRRFTLITDHKPLMTILGPKKTIPQLAAARLQRWALLLSAYDYQLEFRSSQNHSNADGLSRLPLKTEKPITYSSGITRMKALARCHIWWPKLDNAIEQVAKSCQACLSVKQAPPLAPLHTWSWPQKLWQRVHIDFAGPFLNKMYFIAVDAHSKWPEIFEMAQTSTTKTISILRHLFAKYRLPQQIVSDNGPQFTSEEFSRFLRLNGIKHIRPAPYHPASNGQVERLVRTFKQTMKAGERDGLSAQHRLENFLLV